MTTTIWLDGTGRNSGQISAAVWAAARLAAAVWSACHLCLRYASLKPAKNGRFRGSGQFFLGALWAAPDQGRRLRPNVPKRPGNLQITGETPENAERAACTNSQALSAFRHHLR